MSDASISLNVTDSKGNIDVNGTLCNYTWNNGDKTKNISDLHSGIYSVTITDKYNCIDTLKINIPMDNKIAITVNPTNPKICKGDSVKIIVHSSLLTALYSWSPANGLSSTTGAFINAYPSQTTVYNIKASDKIGCFSDTNLTVLVSGLKLDIINYKNKLCFGDTLKITALHGNGIKPYIYHWYPSDINDSQISLHNLSDTVTIENYSVSVKDSLNCKDSTGFTITFLQPLKLTETSDSVCPADCNGSIIVKVRDSNGNPDNNGTLCTYSWSNNDSKNTINNLCSGSYVVTITDNNNCSAVSDNIKIPTIP